MILTLREPAVAEGLGLAIDAVRRLLAALCADPPPADAKAALTAAGWESARPAALRRGVEALLRLDAAERRSVAEAFDADCRFAERLDADDVFVFKVPSRLPAAARDEIATMLRAMYRSVFRARSAQGGFPGAIRPRRLDPRAFGDLFFAANPDLAICPACTRLAIERTSCDELYDLDHYLPNAIYPALAVHPLNLVPVCERCNRRLKRGRDPLAHEGARLPLRSAYVPYRRAAEGELVVEFEPQRPRPRVRLRASGDDERSRERVRGLERLFDLERRWSGYVETMHNGLRDRLAVRLAASGPIDAAAVAQALEAIAREEERLCTREPGAFLRARYCRWLVAGDLGLLAGDVRDLVARTVGA